MEDKESIKINGYREELSDGRHVFVGWNEADHDDNCTYIHFMSAQGEETSFKLSLEARHALSKLLARRWKGPVRWVAVDGDAKE